MLAEIDAVREIHCLVQPVVVKVPADLSPVHETYSQFLVVQYLGPYLIVSHIHKLDSLASERVLVHGYGLTVGENLDRLHIHVPEVVSAHQRRREHAPHREVGDLLVTAHVPVSDLEHLRVIPVAGTGILIQFGHRVYATEYTDSAPVETAVEAGTDVRSHSPEMSYALAPFPRLVLAPFAYAQDYRPSGGLDCVCHGQICASRILSLVVTPVIFEIVHAPVGIGLRIYELIAHASRPALTGMSAGAGVYAEFQPEAVHIVGNRLHSVRKAFRIGDYDPVGIPADLPAVVDDDIFVARVLHSGSYHGVRHLHDHGGAHVAAELVPAVPAHRRGRGKALPLFIGKWNRFFLCGKAAAQQSRGGDQ